MRHLVVIGASLAGMRAVEAARRLGHEGPITLIGAESELPYDRPPLSKKFLTDGCAVDYFATRESLEGDLRVRLQLGTLATGLDCRSGVVHTTRGDVGYDRLIIATGSAPRRLPGLRPLDGVLPMRTLAEARNIRERLRPGARVVIVGGGFIGAEVASAARACNASVTIIEAGRAPLMRAVGPIVGDALGALHEHYGTRLLCSTQVTSVDGSRYVKSVTTSDGEQHPADLVVVGIGAAPATDWLRGSEIDLDDRDGAIVCDAFLRTSVANVFAAGDVAQWPNATFGTTMRLENWTNAANQGAHAAANALAEHSSRPYTAVPYFWSDWYGQRIQVVGSADAAELRWGSGGPDADRFVALYCRGERLVGAATLNEPRKIMKLSRHVGNVGAWADAMDVAMAGRQSSKGVAQQAAECR